MHEPFLHGLYAHLQPASGLAFHSSLASKLAPMPTPCSTASLCSCRLAPRPRQAGRSCHLTESTSSSGCPLQFTGSLPRANAAQCFCVGCWAYLCRLLTCHPHAWRCATKHPLTGRTHPAPASSLFPSLWLSTFFPLPLSLPVTPWLPPAMHIPTHPMGCCGHSSERSPALRRAALRCARNAGRPPTIFCRRPGGYPCTTLCELLPAQSKSLLPPTQTAGRRFPCTAGLCGGCGAMLSVPRSSRTGAGGTSHVHAMALALNEACWFIEAFCPG